ncbi:MAG: dodecin family protein [Actinomycetota bacterium]|nr:dodecin family protein [Actinomycetota bacterium]
MSDHVYHVTEVVGTSTESVDDAIRRAIERSAKTLRNLDWFETTQIRGHLEDGRVEHFQVTLKVGFRLEEPT